MTDRRAIKAEDLSPDQLADIALAEHGVIPDVNDIVYRLRKRAEIRRQIPSRKSVQEGQRDRIADLLEEAADEIDRLRPPPQPTAVSAVLAWNMPGTIKWFDSGKNYGFIKPPVGGDIFILPEDGLAAALTEAAEGKEVIYDLVRFQSSSNCAAKNIRLKEKDDVARNEGPDGTGS